MYNVPATVGHVFPRFLSQFSTDFHAIFQGLPYFRVPSKYRKHFITKYCIVQKLDHPAEIAIQGLCLQREAHGRNLKIITFQMV